MNPSGKDIEALSRENEPPAFISREEHIRKQAILVLELTKGFVPEQRERMGNLLSSLEEMAGYILELTKDK